MAEYIYIPEYFNGIYQVSEKKVLLNNILYIYFWNSVYPLL